MKKLFNKTIRLFGGGNIFIPKKIIKSEYPLNNTNGNNNDSGNEPVVVPNNYIGASYTFIPEDLIIGFGTNPNVTENDFVNPIDFFKDANNKNRRLLCLYKATELSIPNKVIDVNLVSGGDTSYIRFNYVNNVRDYRSESIYISYELYIYIVKL